MMLGLALSIVGVLAAALAVPALAEMGEPEAFYADILERSACPGKFRVETGDQDIDRFGGIEIIAVDIGRGCGDAALVIHETGGSIGNVHLLYEKKNGRWRELQRELNLKILKSTENGYHRLFASRRTYDLAETQKCRELVFFGEVYAWDGAKYRKGEPLNSCRSPRDWARFSGETIDLGDGYVAPKPCPALVQRWLYAPPHPNATKVDPCEITAAINKILKQPGIKAKGSVTFCNRAAVRIIKELGVGDDKLHPVVDPSKEKAELFITDMHYIDDVVDGNRRLVYSDFEWTKANDIFSNLETALRVKQELETYETLDTIQSKKKQQLAHFEELTAAQAQERANRGYVVIAAFREDTPGLSGHVAIVAPDQEVFDPERGPRVGGAGSEKVTGFRYARDVFYDGDYVYDENQNKLYNNDGSSIIKWTSAFRDNKRLKYYQL